MVKFRLPSALARNAWRTFNAGLFLIVIGMVPLLLSVTSRTPMDNVFLAGLALASVGGTLFLVSSCVAICDHVQSVSQVPGVSVEPVWTIDAPPSYEEAVAMQRPQSFPIHSSSPVVTSTDSVVVTLSDMPDPTMTSAKAKCVTLTGPEAKSSAC
ncbi:uncharacterized protein LOC144100883 [Amblyomma americanum]